MAGFFKQWATNAAEHRQLQDELTVVLNRSGINFMHLHPEITKFLVRVAREKGAENAVDEMNGMMAMISNVIPDSTPEQTVQHLIRYLKR